MGRGVSFSLLPPLIHVTHLLYWIERISNTEIFQITFYTSGNMILHDMMHFLVRGFGASESLVSFFLFQTLQNVLISRYRESI